MYREGKSCAIYLRVSTEMQVDGFSLDGQRNCLTRYAEREGMIVKEIYEDAGKSGKSIEGRPAFQRLLNDIQKGLSIDYVLVYKLSRFGRNAADILNSLEFIQSYDINLIASEEGIDSSQASGKLLISVLSAVTEIERENIIEQTMNGRREKARQGGWNGGFAPYGYSLVNGELIINEEEAETIKMIFDLYANTNKGLGGVAKTLNLQGIKKNIRQNGTLDLWTGNLIKNILDNPVYAGKIAYGRRTKEKVRGTKNTYHMVETDNYILEEGKHDAIISEELWSKVSRKREKTGIMYLPTNGKNQVHLLSGVLRCPVCGRAMNTNKSRWKRGDKSNYHYYYTCHFARYAKGHECSYRKQVRKDFIDPYINVLIPQLVSDGGFAEEIKNKLSKKTDTVAIEKEIENYQNNLKEVMQNKNRLEHEIDNLPSNIKYRYQMISDMNSRLYGMYDIMAQIQDNIDDAMARLEAANNEQITIENVYSILNNFSMLYNVITDEEKKQLVRYLIKRIDIYPDCNPERLIKSIELNFKLYNDSITINDNASECVDMLSNKVANSSVSIVMNIDDEFNKRLYEKVVQLVEHPEDKEGTLLPTPGRRINMNPRGKYKTKTATYQQIKDYVKEKYGLIAHTSYIAEIKRKNGIKMINVRSNEETLKKAKHPTPQMTKAIEDALIHFGIIE